MGLLLHAPDDDQGLAEVALGMARRVGQRHEHLPRLVAVLPHVVLDDGVSAGETVLVPEPLEDAGAASGDDLVDISHSSSTATAARILGAESSLSYLSEFPGPPQSVDYSGSSGKQRRDQVNPDRIVVQDTVD